MADVYSTDVGQTKQVEHLVESALFHWLWSSRPAEPPRQALTEPYVNLSIHTALVNQPFSDT